MGMKSDLFLHTEIFNDHAKDKNSTFKVWETRAGAVCAAPQPTATPAKMASLRGPCHAKELLRCCQRQQC